MKNSPAFSLSVLHQKNAERISWNLVTVLVASEAWYRDSSILNLVTVTRWGVDPSDMFLLTLANLWQIGDNESKKCDGARSMIEVAAIADVFFKAREETWKLDMEMLLLMTSSYRKHGYY